MEEFEDGTLNNQELIPCHICNRSFFPKILEKHLKICQKNAAKRRKVFDSSRQRAEGTDIPTLKPLKPKAEPTPKATNWRKKHEDFIATIRAARAVSQSLKDGQPLPPPPPPSYDPDYIQCPYCQRRFNENAAERHIKFCQEQAARMGNRPKTEVKKTPTRTQYKPPAPVKKTTPLVSNVSSASSRLPQRGGPGQFSGRTPSAGVVRSSPSGLISPPSGVGLKQRVTSSGYGSVRNAPGTGIKKKVDSYISRNEVDGENDVGNGGIKSKFCHQCGTKYPVESAKFCCECGVRRMCL